MSDPTPLEVDIVHAKTLRPGDDHYRAFVGPPGQYDFMGATQFALLFMLGIREEHRLLDVGCGSLRAGRYLIQYLLPDRYHGIEPNESLWQEAVEREIGTDLIRLKRPRFSSDTDFTFSTFGERFDFIVAQSIFSHTGAGLFERGLAEAGATLADDGQFLFTVLDETAFGFGTISDGRNSEGWFYPECVTFPGDHVESRCRVAGLYAQALDWFHPRQRWYRAVRNEELLLTDDMRAALGSGRPLDQRFKR